MIPAKQIQSILVKLPVKLGDTIMASYFLRALKAFYPEASVDVIMAEALVELADFMPYVDRVHGFSKANYQGIRGNIRYGKQIAAIKSYDLFFCLPWSFSSALSGLFTNTKVRIGFRTECRGFLLTRAPKRPAQLHIVEEFNYLLEQFTGQKIDHFPLDYSNHVKHCIDLPDEKRIILNIMSGPTSRYIPVNKSISLVNDLLAAFPHQITLTGAPHKMDYIEKVATAFADNPRVTNFCGQTTLSQLAYLISKSHLMVSTDTGTAHLANALRIPTVVLFGAAQPGRAKPYETSISTVLTAEGHSCMPCEAEHCKFKDNRCLTDIPNEQILKAAISLIGAG